MQFHWLNKQNNNNLIVFFAGWSFDYKPFEFLDCENYDVLMVYDYNTLENVHELTKLINNPAYKQRNLIAWSMGVFTAYQLKNELSEFNKKIAVNGTPFPVDDEFGIPQKPFLLTLRHAKTGLEGKFYKNIFDKDEEFEKYVKSSVERSIDNRVEELHSLYDKIKTDTTDKFYDDAFDFYDKALVSSNDKIIPFKNQMNFWKSKAEIINSGHFLFYNFKNWNEILCR